MAKYDKCSLSELNELEKHYKARQTRELQLLRCYEAKIKRVEPLSEEFENTLNGIFSTQNVLKSIGVELTRIRLNIIDWENYYMDKRE